MKIKYYPFWLFLSIFLSCQEKDMDYLVTIKTNYGDMHAVLHDKTPKHKENFIKLAQEGFYDSLLFHRVINNFMIQGGDPNSKNNETGQPLGTGGPGYTIPAEFDIDLFHAKGAISAARTGDQMNPQKESSGSQFYIVDGRKFSETELITDVNELSRLVGQYLDLKQDDSLKDVLMDYYETQDFDAYTQVLLELKEDIEKALNVSVDRNYPQDRLKAYTTIGGTPHLDDNYTVFGQVIAGLEVIDKIASQPTNRNDQPVENIYMTVEIAEMSREEITKQFGYEFPEQE